MQWSLLSLFETIPSWRRRRPDKASSKIPFMVTMVQSLRAGMTMAADMEVKRTKKILKASALKFTEVILAVK